VESKQESENAETHVATAMGPPVNVSALSLRACASLEIEISKANESAEGSTLDNGVVWQNGAFFHHLPIVIAGLPGT
jgi:hypothetical protein